MANITLVLDNSTSSLSNKLSTGTQELHEHFVCSISIPADPRTCTSMNSPESIHSPFIDCNSKAQKCSVVRTFLPVITISGVLSFSLFPPFTLL